jgi:hypothetical protein
MSYNTNGLFNDNELAIKVDREVESYFGPKKTDFENKIEDDFIGNFGLDASMNLELNDEFFNKAGINLETELTSFKNRKINEYPDHIDITVKNEVETECKEMVDNQSIELLAAKSNDNIIIDNIIAPVLDNERPSVDATKTGKANNKKTSKKEAKEVAAPKPKSLVNAKLPRYLAVSDNILETYKNDKMLFFTRQAYENEDDEKTDKLHEMYENAWFTTDYKDFAFYTYALGVVIFLDKSHYTFDKEENLKIDFDYTKEDMVAILYTYFTLNLKVERKDIKQIVVGHEYTPLTNKCHYQCCITFNKKVKRTFYPVTFVSAKYTYRLMMQKAKHSKNLATYCRKDGDVAYYGVEDNIFKIVFKKDKEGNDTEDANVPLTIVANDNKSPEDLKAWMFKRFPAYAISNYGNLTKAIDAHCQEDLPEFKWVIPPHIANSDNPVHRMIATHITSYFMSDSIRTKALIILGPINTGKTLMAKELVNHSSYYGYFRNTFSKEQATKKLSTMKLLILDDFTFMKNEEHEMFKALLSGEEMTLNCKYYQSPIKEGYRTIFLTNNVEFVKRIYSHHEFDGRYTLVILEDPVIDYLGPEGTRRADLSNGFHLIPGEWKHYLDEARGNRVNPNLKFSEQHKEKLTIVENDLGLKNYKGNSSRVYVNNEMLLSKVTNAIEVIANNNNTSIDTFVSKKNRKDVLLENRLVVANKKNVENEDKLMRMETLLAEQQKKMNELYALMIENFK